MEHIAVSSPRSGEDHSEDAYVVIESGGTFLAAVIDTHHRDAYTHEQASAVARATAEAFREGAEAPRDRLARALAHADQFLLRHHPDFGAVVTGVEVRGSQMQVAQLGDSLLYQSLSTQGGSEVLTPAHTGQNLDELRRMEPWLLTRRFQIRVEGHDGRLTHRLYHRRRYFWWNKSGLIPTRSIGNGSYRPALTSEPEVLTFDLRAFPPTLFALCTDGAWSTVERMYRRLSVPVSRLEMEEVQSLLEQGFLFEHDDDATVVCFRHG